ncbi:MAG: epoxyqueuosine reductase [Clostridiaceae bacterium]
MLRKTMEDKLKELILEYCEKNGVKNIWKDPIIKYADAKDEEFLKLKQLVMPTHYLPEDVLENPVTVLSYFIPFKKEIGLSNIKGYDASKEWGEAYLATNTMAAALNIKLAEFIKSLGYDAAVPQNIGFDPKILMSNWSQRHVARIAGQGTFGINNMLISDVGCCGRYFSKVTTLPIEPDVRPTVERCSYKRDGSCGVCVERCVGDALDYSGFNRAKCYEVCLYNEKTTPGAEVCGKCVVGIPCSFSSMI